MKLDFSGQIFEKITQIKNFMKTGLVGAELFRANGQRNKPDVTKL